jgi:hypothetical protein
MKVKDMTDTPIEIDNLIQMLYPSHQPMLAIEILEKCIGKLLRNLNSSKAKPNKTKQSKEIPLS